MSDFMKICAAEAKLLCMERWADMTKLTVTLHYFANMLKNDM